METRPVTQTTPNRLLIVDDDPGIGRFIAAVAEDLGFTVSIVGNVAEFKDRVAEFEPTHVVTDLQMPGADGIELLRYLATENCEALVTVISGLDSRVVKTALQVGENLGLRMNGALTKPIEIRQLENLLSSPSGSPKAGPTAGELAEGIPRGELVAYFQPKFSRADGLRWTANEVEALVRWQHPEHGLLSPNILLPLAVEGGLLDLLTSTMLEQAVQRIRAWEADGHIVSVAVNLPPELLADLAIPDRLAAICEKAGVAPDRIILEVTETAAMANPKHAMEILTRARVKGFRLAVDDFGTGFSSLQELYRMPFTELKIDRAFISDIAVSEEARAIVEVSLLLARRLGLKSCAEGVETEAQLNFLSQHGCDTVQGFYFSRPVDQHVIITILSSDKTRSGDA